MCYLYDILESWRTPNWSLADDKLAQALLYHPEQSVDLTLQYEETMMQTKSVPVWNTFCICYFYCGAPRRPVVEHFLTKPSIDVRKAGNS